MVPALSERDVNVIPSSRLSLSSWEENGYHSSDFEKMSMTSDDLPNYLREEEETKKVDETNAKKEREEELERRFNISQRIQEVIFCLLPYPKASWDFANEMHEYIYLTSTKAGTQEVTLFHALYLLQRFAAIYSERDILPHPKELWVAILILSMAHVQDCYWTAQGWTDVANIGGGRYFTWTKINALWFQLLEQFDGRIGGEEARRVTLEWERKWGKVRGPQDFPCLEMRERVSSEYLVQSTIVQDLVLYPWDFKEHEPDVEIKNGEGADEELDPLFLQLDDHKKATRSSLADEIGLATTARTEDWEDEDIESIFQRLHDDIKASQCILAEEMRSIFDS
ncbi:hypothetical protein BT69DRAFT_1337783 [Atractiella rhizophila]|nr:hypothetical protein BT69DRAFT_1337783 [Atractiella rhizophila]